MSIGKLFLAIILMAGTVALFTFLIATYGVATDIKAQNEKLLEIALFDEAMRFAEIIKAEQLSAKAATGEWIQAKDFISFHTSSYSGWKMQTSHAVDNNAGVPAYVCVTIVHRDPYDSRTFTVYSDSTIHFQ